MYISWIQFWHITNSGLNSKTASHTVVRRLQDDDHIAHDEARPHTTPASSRLVTILTRLLTGVLRECACGPWPPTATTARLVWHSDVSNVSFISIYRFDIDVSNRILSAANRFFPIHLRAQFLFLMFDFTLRDINMFLCVFIFRLCYNCAVGPIVLYLVCFLICLSTCLSLCLSVCLLLPAGSAAGSSAGIVFTHGPIFGFFAPQGRHVAPIKVKFGGAPPCQISPWSVQGWGFTAPKTGKNWNFTNIIAPNRRFLCTIFTKFISFMRVISIHKPAKFGCFISINNKNINNLPRWGHFQPNFRRPLA